MRPIRLPRRSWPRSIPWRFPSLVAACRADFRLGYFHLGAAIATELPVLAPRLAAPEHVAQLRDAVAHGDDRAVVGWLVKHGPLILREVPRERRYASFSKGIRAGLATLSATTWCIDPRFVPASVAAARA